MDASATSDPPANRSSSSGSKRPTTGGNADDSVPKKAKEKNNAATAAASNTSQAFSIQWLDEEPAFVENGDAIYNKAQITVGSAPSFIVRQGDAVFTTTNQVCLVHRFIVRKQDSNKSVLMEGHWCLNQKEIVAKLGSTRLTPETEVFLDVLTGNEVVLTNLMDANEVSCIAGLCKIHFQKLTGDAKDATGADKICRYRLKIDATNKTIDWKEMAEQDSANENDEVERRGKKQDKMDVDEESKQKQEPEDVEMAEDDTVGTILSGSDDDCDSLSTNRVPIQGEGSNFDGEIRVGPKFQMPVGPFHPKRRVRSRGAKLVYKANILSDNELTQFLSDVASLHNQFLAEQKMTMKDPYILLHQERADDFVTHLPKGYPVTGSVMSTASSMGGGDERIPLLKECNPDAVLELLSDHAFDTARALDAIRDDLDAISCGWTQPEKAVFDAGFRRHEGELREIGDVMFPTKSVRDVVDYHYRFKIPEQFRKYQSKKREQALRITQCIQNRKFGEALNGGGNNAPNPSTSTTWTDKSMGEVTESRRERLQTARNLLLDVMEQLGKKKMVKVAGIIRKLQASYDRETRDNLFEILNGQPRLQKRFVEFLPKNV